MNDADAHARRSDPVSSHVAVQQIARATSLHEWVRRAGADYRTMFTDTDLWVWVEELSGRRQQRNVIARTRGLHTVPHGRLEPWFEAIGTFPQDGKLLVHYRFIGDVDDPT